MALSSALDAMSWVISVVWEFMVGERSLADFVCLRCLFLCALPLRVFMLGLASGWGCAWCMCGLLADGIVCIFGGVLDGLVKGV